MTEELSIVLACVSMAGSVAAVAGGYAVNRSQVMDLRAKAAALETKIEQLEREMVSKEMLKLHLDALSGRVQQMLDMQTSLNRRLDNFFTERPIHITERPNH